MYMYWHAGRDAGQHCLVAKNNLPSHRNVTAPITTGFVVMSDTESLFKVIQGQTENRGS